MKKTQLNDIVLENVDDILSFVNIVINESIESSIGHGRKAKADTKAGVQAGAMRQAQQSLESQDDEEKDNEEKDSNVHDKDEDEVSITIDSIVTRLNSIRSGRSFKDSDVNDEMEHYFNELDDAEKLALYAFLSGISEIVAGGEQGEDANEPTDAKVKMKTDVNVTSKQEKNPNGSQEHRQSQRYDSTQDDREKDDKKEDRKKKRDRAEDDSPPIRATSR